MAIPALQTLKSGVLRGFHVSVKPSAVQCQTSRWKCKEQLTVHPAHSSPGGAPDVVRGAMWGVRGAGLVVRGAMSVSNPGGAPSNPCGARFNPGGACRVFPNAPLESPGGPSYPFSILADRPVCRVSCADSVFRSWDSPTNLLLELGNCYCAHELNFPCTLMCRIRGMRVCAAGCPICENSSSRQP
jgi:hypothetical protein